MRGLGRCRAFPDLLADATRAGRRRRFPGGATGRAGAGGRDAEGQGGAAVRPAVAGLPAGPPSASPSGPGWRGARCAGGAGRWRRCSRALGPPGCGCGTRTAGSGWYAAPTPPIRPWRGWWRSRRTPEARAGHGRGRRDDYRGSRRAAGLSVSAATLVRQGVGRPTSDRACARKHAAQPPGREDLQLGLAHPPRPYTAPVGTTTITAAAARPASWRAASGGRHGPRGCGCAPAGC
jgi:hypothetical protein